ncbi:MAG TPA: substrate-binding domain-containing protein [Rhodanobacteraceae bacterium]|jgi:phosphate transport system substrate-binding protein|nr:substrate-binding domain-containing protein [Rhodanobacteraceae bacterium]
MFLRPLSFVAASLSLALATVATAAPTPQASRHHKSSSPALMVRGDQVSTNGLVAAVAKAFAATGDGHIEFTPFNTIDGIDQAIAGTIDIAASARPAYPKRTQEAALTFTPVAWDALVMITNASNPVDNLTLKQLHDIYYGRIKNWSKLGGRDEPIDLDGVASPLDGVQFSFRRLMFGNGNNPVAVPRLFINIDSLQQEVSLDTKALAVSTMVHARRQKGIKIIAIEGVTPSVATLENATYALPMKIYLAWKADSPKADTIRKLLSFLEGPKADEILRSHDLLPYDKAVVLNARTESDRINTVAARMIAEGLPPEYSPSSEFARLAALYPDMAHTARLQQVAADQVAKANKQRIALAEAAGVDPSPQAAAKAAPETYTVVSGDTLSKIAQGHSVTVDELRTWNHLDSDTLQVGQQLKVSSP